MCNPPSHSPCPACTVGCALLLQPLNQLPGPPSTVVFYNPSVLGHKTSAPGTEPASEDGIRIEVSRP